MWWSLRSLPRRPPPPRLDRPALASIPRTRAKSTTPRRRQPDTPAHEASSRTAGDVDALAVDVAAAVGNEKRDDVGDVIRLSDAPQRVARRGIGELLPAKFGDLDAVALCPFSLLD